MTPPEELGVHPVAYGSAEYEATVELRREVLRRPLGLDFTPEQLAAERDDSHLALFENGEAVGCLILTRKDETTVKMRQVAVRPDQQGKGIGRRIVGLAESVSYLKGYRRMVLNARETAVPFYLALGYALEGEPFEEVGIPHRAMSKALKKAFPSLEEGSAEGGDKKTLGESSGVASQVEGRVGVRALRQD